MVVLLLSGALVSSAAPISAPSVRAQSEGRLYPQTGYTLAPEFIPFYDANGGIPLFGYPVTEAYTEGGYLIQWTERQRLEWHPENAGTPYEVQIGLLGNELTKGLNGPSFSSALHAMTSDPQQSSPGNTTIYFPETGQTVAEPFASYWQQKGGLAIFGYPISSLYTDDTGLQVQWFQRARFELHPELQDPYKVLLGQLGTEALNSRSEKSYQLRVYGTPAPDSALQIGLAQGGESSQPSFFDNIRQPANELGPGLVRLDNIYNFYNVVQRGISNTVSYRWDDLDKVIDGIRAMGKEPFICLSYMPETFSATGNSRVSPPLNYEDWGRLVRATVQHLNVDRKLGIRYWEVWNEPNEWDFWQASFPDYLKLYDTTVAAATSADPTIMIGGPSLSRFSADHLRVFLDHEASLGAKGRVDFLSWHSYGQTPDEIAADIRQVRAIAAEYPQFHPQLIVSEFNVRQGGQGDTSANGYTDKVEGAISFLSSIESMQRERLDQALLFELKDGAGPQSFWGRWGILTNDGQPKPIYYALKAYQNRPAGMLPVTLTEGQADGSVGMMAFGSPQNALLILWYTGEAEAKIKVSLPDSFSPTQFDVTLFDKTHNNPAVSGDPTLEKWLQRNAGDLLFDLQPNSLVLITSR